ncbi:hypothetical protein C2S08_02965 [Helicobacter pylori]|nr:hypothetical protein C2S08_02965 [Helicobacter pylori]
MVGFGDDETLNIQRFLNLSFWISFCCKTLKGVGDIIIPLCNLIKIPLDPYGVHRNEIRA